MLVFLRCVGEAVVARGMRGLMGLAPFGEQIYEVARDAIERYRQLRREDQLADDLEAMVQADMVAIRAEAQAIARAVAAGRPAEEVEKVEGYLTQVPGVARQSLRRPKDPTGNTVPPDWNLSEPIRLATMLPQRAPRFRVGESVPNAPQWLFEQLLGAGGFGEVWLARHSFLQKLQAFKFCLDAEARERLLYHEAEVVKRVMEASGEVRPDQHGIVPLLDVCLIGDTPWLAYEFVDGGDLTGMMLQMKNTEPAQRALHGLVILRQLSLIVGKFHLLPQPVIHRDLKPANILTRQGSKGYVLRVTDFGISQIESDQALRAAATSHPSVKLGDTYRGAHTPMYASPQQKRGNKADVRDDVYALGILGFQLILGDIGAEAPRGRGWRRRVADAQVSEAVLDLLERCWDDDADERPAHAQALAEALAAAMPAMPQSRTTPAPIRGSTEVRGQTQSQPLSPTPPPGNVNRPTTVVPPALTPALPPASPAAPRIPKPGEILRDTAGMKLAWIPAGKFLMGSPSTEPQRGNDENQVSVEITKGFYLGIYPVTVEQFKHFIDATKHRTDAETGTPIPWQGKMLGQGAFGWNTATHKLEFGEQYHWRRTGFAQGLDFPVVCVSYHDASAFCSWWSSRTGATYRIPTEAEWEYACRAGTATPFSFGNSLDAQKANCNGQTPYNTSDKGPWLQHPSAVGSYAPNAWGLYDMHGNVWEWCADYYQAILPGGLDPVTNVKSQYQVDRGGSWYSPASSCRSAHRSWDVSEDRHCILGFRVARIDN